MTFLTELRECVDVLSDHSELDVEPEQLLAQLRSAGGESAMAVLAEASAVIQCIDRVKTVATAVISELSARDRGHGGFAATRGHRSPVALVQSISGGTRADAVRAVRIGESLLDVAQATGASDSRTTGPHTGLDAASGDRRRVPWHDGLAEAMLRGLITQPQHEAILRGLAHPPVDSRGDVLEGAVEVWAIAADQLMAEATGVTTEELLRRARTVRDLLDPLGAEARFSKRYDARSFRMWIGDDGAHHGHILFDDEMAAWVRSIIDAALRPRRGGPRFVDADEQRAAQALVDDGRSNEQLSYDLLMDVLRAGAITDASDVFGVRQPGVRMMIVKDSVGPRDAFGRLLAVGHHEDGGGAAPGAVIDRHLCGHGSVDVTVDTAGNPLDVGREQRLFTPKQRIALAMRDGGCRWQGCGQPASYCESHHIDQWQRDRGRTDIDRGILLCRFHHMLLHHNGWRIARDGLGPFVLHHPPNTDREPVVLRTKAAWAWAWDPPPECDTWRAA